MLNPRRIQTILLLEEDNDARNALVENLTSQNYCILIAVNKQNAIDWIQNLVKAPDVFLVNQIKIPLEEYIVMIQDLYSQTLLLPSMPTIILADWYSDDL